MRISKVLTCLSLVSCHVISGCAANEEQSDGAIAPLSRTYSYDVSDQCYYTSACYSVQVGSSDVDTSKLAPYHAIWTQRIQKEGAWVTSPTIFEERLFIGEDGNWVHVQNVQQGDGSASIGTRSLAKDTFQILDLTITFKNASPQHPSKVYYDMTGNSFVADISYPDGRKVKGQARDLAMPMFAGQIGGLTIATLPLREGYVATLPMVIPNLGVYWIEASVVGRAEIQVGNEQSVAVWEVNANWLNLADGDIYEPGRDGDGGVYYIAINPGDGVPPVIEYANDGTIITWDGVRRK